MIFEECTPTKSGFAISVMVAMTAFGVLNVIGIIFLFVVQPEQLEDAVEATLLSTGLSIIGIAIAVWSGLNIVNAVNRKELNKLQKDFFEIKDKMEAAQKTIDKYEKDAIRIKDSVNANLEDCKLLFLQELLKSKKDIASRYFYYWFETQEITLDNVRSFLNLTQIERIFAEIYNLHDSKLSRSPILAYKANFVIDLISVFYKENQVDEEIGQFLEYRIAEVNFYKAYCELDFAEIYECLKSAISSYLKFAKKVGCFDLTDDDMDELPEYSGKNIEMACYLANSIGESYSKIVLASPDYSKSYATHKGRIDKNEIQKCGERAVFYCKCAVHWDKDGREVYCRNLGCAYERLDRITESFGRNKVQILENYKKSFKLIMNDKTASASSTHKIYHVLLSYYERICRHEFSFFHEKIFAEKNKETIQSFLISPSGLDEYRLIVKDMIQKIKDNYSNSEFVNELYEYVSIAELGVTKDCHHTICIGLLGHAYTYVLFLLLAQDQNAEQKFSKGITYYMERVERCLTILDFEFMDEYDDYGNDLRLRYEALKTV